MQGTLEALRSESARPLITTVDHPVIGTYETLLNPVLHDGVRLPIRNPPPSLGEHTDALIRELTSASPKPR